MLETLPPEVAGLGHQTQSAASSVTIDLHPGCGLLDGDESMAVDSLEHQPTALGHA